VYVLQDMLALAQVPWMPPICKTVALDGTGIDDLVAAIAAHQTYLRTGPGERRERARVRRQIEGLVQEALLAQFLEELPPGLFDDIVSRVAVRDLAPHEALAELGL